ncbi:MAG: sensor histidine kinase [Dehalococcoidales bacterium]|nr:MAG: sensor histidine kinase [Dehalococcoidales bacterium]
MVVTDTNLTRSHHNYAVQSAQVLEEIYLARDNERRRLSAEIHDGVVQWMVGALYRINACRHNISPLKPGDLADELANVAMTLKQSVGELRRIITDLRPLPLEKLGLVPALRQAMSLLEEENIICGFEFNSILPKLTPCEERAVFGIVQEALNNVRKHSAASSAHLRLQFRDDAFSVDVFDNGQGFNPEEAIDNQVRPSHIGLLSMKDRAELIGACLQIDSHPGEGTVISLTFSPTSQQIIPTATGR